MQKGDGADVRNEVLETSREDGPKTQVEGFGFNKKRDTDTMPVLQGNESFSLIISASQ